MLTIIRGLPGVGKTFLAHRDYPGSLLLEGDQYYMTPTNSYEFGKGLLRSSSEYVRLMLSTALSVEIKNVVITLTSPDGKRAKEYADIAKSFGHKVRFFWLEYEGLARTVHAVPDEVIDKMKENWRPIRGETMILRKADPTIFDRENCSYKVMKEYPKWYKSLHPSQKRC